MGTEATGTGSRIYRLAVALVVIQVIHALIPADTDAEGFVGLFAGLAALIAGLTAIYGFRTGRAWAVSLTGINGVSVAVGFVLYHGLPITSSFTNPYWGEPKIGVAQWTPVFACIGIGLWCAYEAFVVMPRSSSTAGAATTAFSR